MKRTVMIGEDHALLREGLKTLLESRSDIEVVAEAADGGEAVRKYQELTPDLAILDLSMPRVNGITAVKEIKRDYPDAKVLVLTVHAADEYVYSALEAGADGYVLKEAPSHELLLAVDNILEGRSFISPRVSDKLISGYIKGKQAEQSVQPWMMLTPREREVLTLVATGAKNREIADQLFISVKTVEKHRANMMKKLDLHNVYELKEFAKDNGILP